VPSAAPSRQTACQRGWRAMALQDWRKAGQACSCASCAQPASSDHWARCKGSAGGAVGFGSPVAGQAGQAGQIVVPGQAVLSSGPDEVVHALARMAMAISVNWLIRETRGSAFIVTFG